MWFIKTTNYIGFISTEALFSPDEAAKIIGMKSNGMEVIGPSGAHFMRVTMIKHNDANARWVWQRVAGFINDMNEQYFKMDIQYIEPLQLGEYTPECAHYGQHVDQSFAENVADVKKLSMSVQLSNSNDYDGGVFKMYPNRFDDPFILSRNIGSAALFRSHLIHEVEPVTKGVRYSLVAWVRGPSPK